jgi:hypothetical protein
MAGVVAVMSVFIVHHSYGLDGCDETKLIGVYSSREQADAAVLRASALPGFSGRPDGFSCDEYDLDIDHWREGFVTDHWPEEK